MMKSPKHSKKSPKKIFSLRTLVLVLGALFLGLGIYTWNAERIVGNTVPMPLGFGATVVLSGSMEPEISVDDLAVIVKTKDVAVGDVVLFQAGNSTVLHRVVEVQGDTVITKGDANNAADAPISRNDIKGKMAFSIPSVGVVVDFIKNPIVFLLLALLALLLANFSFRKEKTADTQELDEIKQEIKSLLQQPNPPSDGDPPPAP